MKWYEKNFRRHLTDMHIEDWNESFLSEFHAQDYFDNLKKANVQSVMIALQSHIGVCYYPTKNGKVHNAFVGREDEMKKLIDLCHGENIDVIGYYSLNFNTWAADTYPEWQMRWPDGESNRDKGERYGHCCPNNMEYREFLFEQIKEIIEYVPLEGIFFDMPFWPYPCYCDKCKQRWKEETGLDIPMAGAENWDIFDERRREWMGEFSLAVTEETKRLCPNISVEQNYAHSALPLGVSISHLTNDACDYTGGDLYGDFTAQSFACKYFKSASHNQPFEYMTSRCNPDLANHTVTKTSSKLSTGIMLTCAHHGATLMIDAMDPAGTLNPSFYSELGELFEKEKVYEPFLTGEMLEDVGIFCHYGAKANLQRQQGNNNHAGCVNTVKAMIEQHIPNGVIASENMGELEKYKFIVLPNPNHLTEDMIIDLVKYVEDGGTLYFSNTDEEMLFHILVGGECKGYTEHSRTYVGAKEEYLELFEGYGMKYPLPFDYKLPIVSGIEDKYVVANIILPYTLPTERRCASIHSNPPGPVTEFPAVVVKTYGKGRVIWSAAPIECVQIVDYRKIIGNFVRKYANGNIRLTSNASPIVELICFKDDKEKVIRVNAVNLNDNDYSIVQPKFEVTLAINEKVKGVYLLPEYKEVAFRVSGAGITFEARELETFDMYEIKYE